MEKRFKNYKDCISYLFDLERVGIKYDLKNTRTILKHLNNPHKKFKSIHIAGTNGKGSVAAFLNSVLIEKGLRTGLYTSPHIPDFRERILVNGKMISNNFIIDFTNRLFKLIEDIKPSFYEISTALAFEYFRVRNVKYAIVETGLGGRLDSTNVLNPILTIVTGISIDHTEFLGNTIKSIAGEKAGIIKRNVPCVLGHVNNIVKNVFTDKCKSKNSKLLFAPSLFEIEMYKKNENGFLFSIKSKERALNAVKCSLVGEYQTKNICTSLAALNQITEKEGIKFSDAILHIGFNNVVENSKFYGRFQLISVKPSIVIDVSHNLESLSNIECNLKHFTYDRLVIIFALMKEKEYKKCLKEIEKLNTQVVLTKPQYKRALEPTELYKVAKRKENFVIKENVKEAFLYAKDISNKSDLILITGSFFLVSDFLKFYNKYFK